MSAPIPDWLAVSADARLSDPSDCAARARAFERRIRRRNVAEYAAGGSAALAFFVLSVGALWFGEWMIALASGLTCAGALLVLRNLARKGSNLAPEPGRPCVTHLKRQYQRQYDALRSVASWYIAPLVPGMLLLLGVITYRIAEVRGWQSALQDLFAPAAVVFAVFAAVIVLNGWAAAVLKRKIRALEEQSSD